MYKRDTSDLILDPRGVHRWGSKAQPAHWMAWAINNLSASFESTVSYPRPPRAYTNFM